MFSFDELKAKHRHIFPMNSNFRVHCVLGWLKRAEAEQADCDTQFIFLWVVFNAAYASEYVQRRLFSEQKQFLEFIGNLMQLESEKQL